MADNDGNALKALILAAGLGTRLRPLTDHYPKPLATVLGVPLFDSAVIRCVQGGAADLAVNTHHMADVMAKHAKDHFQALGARSLHLSREVPEILGTGGALAAISDWWGTSQLLVYNGDILSEIDLNGLVSRQRSSNGLVTMAVRDLTPRPGDRSVWVNASGEVLHISKKENLPEALRGERLYERSFACAYIASPKLREILPETAVFFDIIAAFNKAIAAGHKIFAESYAGYWADIGDPKSLWQTNLDLLKMSPEQQTRLIGQPSRLANLPDPKDQKRVDSLSVISPSAKLGRSCVVKNSVLLHDALVGESEILENAIRGSGLDQNFS